MRPLLTLVSTVAIIFAGLSACAAQAIDAPQPLLSQSPLTIETSEGPISFVVELADDPVEVRTGMMFRQEIGDFEGMLFDMGRVREAAFWMRNTLIPLDIIFIEEDGTILRIAADAVPQTDDPIYSYGPVRGVLEIGGGRAAELGLEAGDLVRHPLFRGTP